tara:strand:- start:3349 stop:4599 length:1251 start_codon:yes stop_codon:yes gene_type:complete
MKKYKKLRGMSDSLPSEVRNYESIESIFKKNSSCFGYQEVRFPLIEETELFSRTVGEDSDIVNKEMFTFSSKSGKSMTLRPEGTAGCMRMAIENGLLDEGSQRLMYLGPMFRYERPQKGRTRQFNQMSLEAYGISDFSIDIEMIQISNKIFKDLNISNSVTLEINSIGNLEDQKKYAEQLRKYFSKYEKDLDENNKARLSRNPLRILDSKDKKIKEIVLGAPEIKNVISKSSMENFEKITSLLGSIGINFKINQNLVRGLDYYNDLVFEWKSSKIGSQETICGGGRYDFLSKILGGREVPAIGLSFGLERLSLCVNSSVTEAFKKLQIIVLDKAFFLNGIKLAEELRQSLDNYSIQFLGNDTNLKNALRKASKKKLDYMVIIGREEIDKKVYTLKNLKKEKEYKSLNKEKLITLLN